VWDPKSSKDLRCHCRPMETRWLLVDTTTIPTLEPRGFLFLVLIWTLKSPFLFSNPFCCGLPNPCIGLVECGEFQCAGAASCVNTTGSETCTCNTGYQGNGTSCTDCNECAGQCGGNDCSADALCTNTVGSFTCSCNPGFGGNGVNCTG